MVVVVVAGGGSLVPKMVFGAIGGAFWGKKRKFGSTTLRVPESSLTSVLTKPVVA